MNTSVRGTGDLQRTEEPNSIKVNSEPLQALVNRITFGSTGLFQPQTQENNEDRYDPDSSLEILDSESDREVRLAIINECEEIFNNGLVTGRSELDVLNHVFSHLYNGIPALHLGKVKDVELAQAYLNRVKKIILTYVEYIHFVRGVDRHKIKSFLANDLMTLKEEYNEDRINLENLSTLKFINTFLPDLIASLKDKFNLAQFTESFIALISYMRQNNGVSFVTLMENKTFAVVVNKFRENFLLTTSSEFENILSRIHSNLVSTHSNVVTQTTENGELRSHFFDTLRELNSPQYIGNDIDFFINALTRVVRNKIVPASTIIFENPQYVLDRLRRPVAESHRDSRESFYQTKLSIESKDIKPRVSREVISQFHLDKFNQKMGSLIGKITEFRGRGEDSNPPQILKRLFNDDKTLEVRDPLLVVDFFCKLFESAIIYLDGLVLEDSGMTLSEETIGMLFRIWKNELHNHFELNANLTPVRVLEDLDWYVFINLRRQIEITPEYEGTSPLERYASTIYKRLQNKIAIIEAKKDNIDPDLVYEQFILEMFSTGIIRADEYSYVDTWEELVEDFEVTKPNTMSYINLISHVLRTIPQIARIRFGPKVSMEKIARFLHNQLNKDIRYYAIATQFFELKNNETLEDAIISYFKTPHTQPLVEVKEA